MTTGSNILRCSKLPNFFSKLQDVGFEKILHDRRENVRQTNKTTIETLLNDFIRNVKGFHLPGLPTIGEISDLSENVTHSVKQEIKDKLDGLPTMMDDLVGSAGSNSLARART